MNDEQCLQSAGHCICVLSANHEGPHICSCRGSWEGTIDQPNFVPVRFPGWPS